MKMTLHRDIGEDRVRSDRSRSVPTILFDHYFDAVMGKIGHLLKPFLKEDLQ
jgi:hypothetical protein